MGEQSRRLVVVEGPEAGRRYELEGLIVTLGRAADNTIVIDSPRVSRHHTQLRLLPGGATIEDLGSTNGTWLNQRRIAGPQNLSPGDRFSLADYITFEYVAGEAGYPATQRYPSEGAASWGATVRDDEPVTYTPSSPGWPSPGKPEGGPPPGAPPPASPPPEVPPLPELPPSLAASPAGRSRPTWVYILIGVLVLLICLCVAGALYLWFAPVEFWERLYEWLNIPLPTGSLLGLLCRVPVLKS